MTTKGFDFRAARDSHDHPSPLLLHSLVASFWLPLDVVPIATNAAGTPETAKACAGIRRDASKRALDMMRFQWAVWKMAHGDRYDLPLQHATVRVVRYSQKRPDSDNGSTKVPLDILQPTRPHRGKTVQGLGLIVGDDDLHCRKLPEWRPAPRGKGAVLVEVWLPRDERSWALGSWTIDDVARAKSLLSMLGEL
jgi:hypothetical protein